MRRWAANFLLAVLLAGCGDDGETPAKPHSPRSSDTSSEEQPGSSSQWPPVSLLDIEKPQSPVADDGPRDQASARAYVAYLVELVNYTLATTYVDDDLRNSRCAVCASVVELADDAMAKHHLFKTEGWKIKTIGLSDEQLLVDPGPITYTTLDVVLDIPPIVIVDDKGVEVTRSAALTLPTRIVVGEASTWYVELWSRLDAQADT